VQEYVLNTYDAFDDYSVAEADAYWADTAGYWAAVRREWDAVAEERDGITITEEAQTGTVISGRLLTIANEIRAGELTEGNAITEARGLIRSATAGPAKTPDAMPEESGAY